MEHSKHIIFCLLLTVFMMPSFARAQNGQDMPASVQIDLGVLDELEGYDPPPMFDDTDPPLTGRQYVNKPPAVPLKKVTSFPIDTRTEYNSLNPNFDPHAAKTETTPEIPDKDSPLLPLLEEIAETKELFNLRHVNVPKPTRKPYFNKSKRTQSPTLQKIVKAPPIPERRPAKLHASKSFIEEIARERKEQTQTIQVKKTALPPPMPHPTQNTPDSMEQLISLAPAAGDINPEYEQKPSVQNLVLSFEKGATELAAPAQVELRQKALNVLNRNQNLRLEIQAFASPSDEGRSSARRVSLSRAISVRSFLIENGTDPKRIDIRALGDQTSTPPPDRVDLIFVSKGKTL